MSGPGRPAVGKGSPPALLGVGAVRRALENAVDREVSSAVAQAAIERDPPVSETAIAVGDGIFDPARTFDTAWDLADDALVLRADAARLIGVDPSALAGTAGSRLLAPHTRVAASRVVAGKGGAHVTLYLAADIKHVVSEREVLIANRRDMVDDATIDDGVVPPDSALVTRRQALRYFGLPGDVVTRLERAGVIAEVPILRRPRQERVYRVADIRLAAESYGRITDARRGRSRPDPRTLPDRALVETEDAARAVGVSRESIRRWVEVGLEPAARPSAGLHGAVFLLGTVREFDANLRRPVDDLARDSVVFPRKASQYLGVAPKDLGILEWLGLRAERTAAAVLYRAGDLHDFRASFDFHRIPDDALVSRTLACAVGPVTNTTFRHWRDAGKIVPVVTESALGRPETRYHIGEIRALVRERDRAINPLQPDRYPEIPDDRMITPATVRSLVGVEPADLYLWRHYRGLRPHRGSSREEEVVYRLGDVREVARAVIAAAELVPHLGFHDPSIASRADLVAEGTVRRRLKGMSALAFKRLCYESGLAPVAKRTVGPGHSIPLFAADDIEALREGRPLTPRAPGGSAAATRTTAGRYVIRNTHGNVLWSGDASSARDAVEQASRIRRGLIGADLRDLDLEGVRLRSADLTRADLRGAKLSRADLTEAVLDGARIGSRHGERAMQTIERLVARGARLHSADIDRAVFVGSDLQGACLDDASVTGCRFERSLLRGMRGRRAYFGRTAFVRCLMDGARLDGLGAGGEVQPVFDRVTFEGVTARGLAVTRAIVTDSRFGPDPDLQLTTLENADFDSSTLRRTSFADVTLRGAALVRARLRGVSIAGGTMDSASIGYADLERVVIAGTSMADLHVEQCVGLSVTVTSPNLSPADRWLLGADVAVHKAAWVEPAPAGIGLREFSAAPTRYTRQAVQQDMFARGGDSASRDTVEPLDHLVLRRALRRFDATVGPELKAVGIVELGLRSRVVLVSADPTGGESALVEPERLRSLYLSLAFDAVHTVAGQAHGDELWLCQDGGIVGVLASDRERVAPALVEAVQMQRRVKAALAQQSARRAPDTGDPSASRVGQSWGSGGGLREIVATDDEGRYVVETGPERSRELIARTDLEATIARDERDARMLPVRDVRRMVGAHLAGPDTPSGGHADHADPARSGGGDTAPSGMVRAIWEPPLRLGGTDGPVPRGHATARPPEAQPNALAGAASNRAEVEPGLGAGLFIVAGPSGSGKTTIVNALVARMPNVSRPVTATTRPPRPGERDAVDYHFVSRNAFTDQVAAGRFLEHTEFGGHLYGTPVDAVDAITRRGAQAVLIVDVNGASAIRAAYPASKTIFIEPPSLEVLGERLCAREFEGGDVDEQRFAHRLATAEVEMGRRHEFDHRVVNADLETSISEVAAIIRGPRKVREMEASFGF